MWTFVWMNSLTCGCIHNHESQPIVLGGGRAPPAPQIKKSHNRKPLPASLSCIPAPANSQGRPGKITSAPTWGWCQPGEGWHSLQHPTASPRAPRCWWRPPLSAWWWQSSGGMCLCPGSLSWPQTPTCVNTATLGEVREWVRQRNSHQGQTKTCKRHQTLCNCYC